MKKLNQAHARYERAMAELKSLNLSPQHRAAMSLRAENLSREMKITAMSAEALLVAFKQFHIPAEPAPNAVTQGPIK